MSWKKSAVILSTIGLISSAPAFAELMPSDYSYVVFIPNLKPGFEFSITALALKPGASNLNYVIYNKELPVQSPTWIEKELKPNYDFAFGLDAAYLFPEGKDVTLDWTHLNSTTTATTNAPDASYFLGPDYEIGPDAIPIRHASGKVEFKYDVVNLSAGQFVNFGRRVEMHFFGGISSAFLREQVDATYTGNVLTGLHQGPFSTMQDVTANFTGVGPRLGIGATYDVGCGIGFLGEAAASALIGESQSKTNFTSSAQELEDIYGQSVNYQFIKDQDVMQVIPAFDAKLGIKYRHVFQNNMILELKGGYQAAVYVNAISQYLPGTLVESLTTGGIFVATMNHTLSNFSVHGPFIEGVFEI